MFFRFFLVVLLLSQCGLLPLPNCTGQRVAFTYSLDCGRFGDQLINYIKALWLTEEFKGELLYRPFSLSNLLKLHSYHQSHFSPEVEDGYDFVYRLDKDTRNLLEEIKKKINKKSGSSHLFYVSFYTPEIDTWESDSFRRLLKRIVAPVHTIATQMPPKDSLSVAIHVRKGGGFDRQHAINSMFTKFPGNEFYIDALKKLSLQVSFKPLYAYIFTDDPKPKEIESQFRIMLTESGLKNIRLSSRKRENAYNKNVLEDFFSMMNFDFIIRPDSSYSRAAAAVAGHKIEILPTGWNEFRKNKKGNPIYDKDGKYIVDSQTVIRK